MAGSVCRLRIVLEYMEHYSPDWMPIFDKLREASLNAERQMASESSLPSFQISTGSISSQAPSTNTQPDGPAPGPQTGHRDAADRSERPIR
jgi:hypothetical protein